MSVQTVSIPSRSAIGEPPTMPQRLFRFLRRNAFVLLLISGVVAGIALGVGIRYAKPNWTARELAYFKFPGELLLRMLQMMILPLVITSMISGMSVLGRSASGWIGLRAIAFYLSTTLIAVIIGIILVVTIRPGVSVSSSEIRRQGSSRMVSAVDSLLDLIRNAFSDNMVDACVRKVQTKMTFTVPPTMYPVGGNANTTTHLMSTTTVASGTVAQPTAASDYVPVIESVWGTNLLGVITFSLAFGIALSRIGKRGHVAREFFDGCSEAVLVVVRLIIWFTPIGIVFLISGKIIEMKNVAQTLSQLGRYTATVIAGLVIHGFIVLPLIYLLFVRRNPFRYMYGCLRALLTAVSTASSSATLPVTLFCLEDVNRVSKQITRLMVPVGATINMDGTALYEAVAAVFIAQVNGITLDFARLVIVSITATAAAIGAAGVPEAGLVTMMIVLTAVGLPTEDVALLLAIDWFLDRLRTVINVWGDCVGAGVVEAMSRRELEAAAEMEQAAAAEAADGVQPSDDTGDENGGFNADFVPAVGMSPRAPKIREDSTPL